MDEPSTDTLRAAAILNDGGENADALLAAVAEQQRQRGRRVRGLLMTYPDGAENCAAAMVLVDIDRGDEYLVSQPRGAQSTGCRADPQGFARASRVFDRALGEAPDLVVCNRFGNLEAEGGGFASELLALMAQGVPVLTAVGPRNLAAWLNFSGGATVLPAERARVDEWLERQLPKMPA